MKTVLRLATAITLTVAMALGAPLAASANDDSTVDRAEFDAVKIGYTSTQVQQIFDSPGISQRFTPRDLEKTYRVATGDRTLSASLFFYKIGGVWKLVVKEARWTVPPTPWADPATKSEYLAIKTGMTLDRVRSIIGSAGTRHSDSVMRDNSIVLPVATYRTFRAYVWPQSWSGSGDAIVQFHLKNGVWIVDRKGTVIG